MHKIQIIANKSNEFIIWLFDERGIHLANYSIGPLTAVQAFIYIRGLVALFGAGIDGITSLNAWQYIIAIWNVEGSQN